MNNKSKKLNEAVKLVIVAVKNVAKVLSQE